MATSKSLKVTLKTETKQAAKRLEEIADEMGKEKAGPVDLPTGARSHPPQ